MKPLKALWAATGKPATFYTVMAVCLAFLGHSWYRLAQHYDLQALSGTGSYRLGVVTVLTGIVIAMTLGVAAAALVSRYRPLPIDPALPIDRELPPTEMVYIQGEGEPEHCACHNRPIEDGAVVLHWPQPAKLVCLKEGDRE